MTKVLVIEDDLPIRENIQATLEMVNIETIGAENGLVGIHLARKHLPDLIISDIMMPEVDGYGVLLDLRNDPQTALIPFIFLTAKADKAALREGMDLGADDYLTKPFTSIELLGAVTSRLERHEVIASYHEKKLEDFRGSLVHAIPLELRTPLVAILGGSELLLTGAKNMETDEITEMADNINNAAKQLLHLMENFLLYAQIDLMKPDSERLELLHSSYTVHPKVMIEAQALQKAKEFNRKLDLSLDVIDVERVQVSEDDLMKLVRELVDNAFKFSKVGTPVRVNATVVSNRYCLRISDQGQGMAPQQIDEVGAYIRYEHKVHEEQEMGLGLVIAKALTELHNGTLIFESTLNQGTSAYVSLLLVQDTN